jgi:hypothetical protein
MVAAVIGGLYLLHNIGFIGQILERKYIKVLFHYDELKNSKEIIVLAHLLTDDL